MTERLFISGPMEVKEKPSDPGGEDSGESSLPLSSPLLPVQEGEGGKDTPLSRGAESVSQQRGVAARLSKWSAGTTSIRPGKRAAGVRLSDNRESGRGTRERMTRSCQGDDLRGGCVVRRKLGSGQEEGVGQAGSSSGGTGNKYRNAALNSGARGLFGIDSCPPSSSSSPSPSPSSSSSPPKQRVGHTAAVRGERASNGAAAGGGGQGSGKKDYLAAAQMSGARGIFGYGEEGGVLFLSTMKIYFVFLLPYFYWISFSHFPRKCVSSEKTLLRSSLSSTQPMAFTDPPPSTKSQAPTQVATSKYQTQKPSGHTGGHGGGRSAQAVASGAVGISGNYYLAS